MVPTIWAVQPAQQTLKIAIQLVTVYWVERGLILPIQPVDCKTNEIKALPPVIKALAERDVVFAFDGLNTKKTCE